MASATATDLNPTQQQAFQAFTDKILGRLADSLRMFLGREVTMTAGDLAVLDSAGVRLRLPASAAGLAIALDGAEAPVLTLLELPLAHSLAHLARMGAPEELEALRESPPEPTEDDLEQLRTTSGFFAAAFAEEWPASEAGESSDLILIQDSSWQTNQDPLGDGSWLHLAAECTLESLPADPVTLIIPWSVAEQLVPALAPDSGAAAANVPSAPADQAPASPATDPTSQPPLSAPAAAPPTVPASGTPAPKPGRAALPAEQLMPTKDLGQPMPVVCVGADSVADHVQSRLELGTVTRLADVAALESWLAEGRVPTLVIARVPKGSDDELNRLAALKRDHLLRGHPVMVLLENPVRSTVLQCGRLGLVNVLPAQIDPDVAWRRVAQWLRRSVTT